MTHFEAENVAVFANTFEEKAVPLQTLTSYYDI